MVLRSFDLARPFRDSLAIALLFGLAVAAAEPVRRYDQGPLTSADFRGRPPRPGEVRPDAAPGALAYTSSRIQWTWNYRSVGVDRQWTATAEKIDVFCSLEAELCWNLRPDDRSLLDHEQGHFDITQVWTLKARAKVDELTRGRQLPVGRGTTENAAVKDLQGKLEALFDPYLRSCSLAQSEYDRTTKHGTLPGPQAEQRRQQKETLRGGKS